MFQVISRKPEDIKLENECREKIKQLQDELKDKLSAYDKTLSKYNAHLKKLNNETNKEKIESITLSLKKFEAELTNKSDDAKVIAPNNTVKLEIKKKTKKNENN